MQFFNLLGYVYYGDLAWMNELYKTLPTILYSILAVVGGAGMVYSVILGVNLAKSETEENRKTASVRLRNTIIGIAVLLLLVLFINVFLPMILRAVYPDFVLTPDEVKNLNGGT